MSLDSTLVEECALNELEKQQRREWFQDEIESEIRDTAVEPGQIVFRFPGDLDQTDRLLEYVRRERRCCPSLHFELSWEENRGPIRLKLQHESISPERSPRQWLMDSCE